MKYKNGICQLYLKNSKSIINCFKFNLMAIIHNSVYFPITIKIITI